MEDSHITMHARGVIRFAPWTLGGAVAIGLLTCLFGFAPIAFLLGSVVMGGAGFSTLAVAWRRRSDTLRFFGLFFFLFGQQALWNFTGHGQHFEIAQGFSVLMAVVSAPMVLLRGWLLRFARLETDDQAT